MSPGIAADILCQGIFINRRQPSAEAVGRQSKGVIHICKLIGMKTPYLGTKGHIAVRCNQTARARAYLEKAGIAFREDTAKLAGGILKTIYFTDEIAGFAVHLIGA